MNFDQELENKIKEIEQIIKEYLPQCFSGKTDWAKTVTEAINYSVNAGGKRLRPLLMVETYRLFGGTNKVIEPFMAAIEMIHTYSLVHDDLPAMDNDLYRRGKKTTWAVYGEAMAILAGDGLLNYAFETALKSFLLPDGDANRKARALSILAQKAGIYGMIGGQTADIEAENLGEKVTQEHLLFIHEHKTAALIQAAMMVGAVLAGANEEQVMLVEKAAYEIGIAFQIQDDILDVTSTLETLGKPVGSDAKNQKTTYVTLRGLTEASQEQKELSDHAIKLLNTLEKKGVQNEFLMELIRSLITRVK
ncbi:MAG: polyprenyl synthetase family protein [Lachnospiraceae bacterium]|jgi:geranylgeranyl diphosphate synthase type II|nr:polyprenyl synthetase family protein [Lachnospiraceae bacterium]HBV81424.1 farnesyl-diphosphate synthase [Lachnospiraceae bacterium]